MLVTLVFILGFLISTSVCKPASAADNETKPTEEDQKENVQKEQKEKATNDVKEKEVQEAEKNLLTKLKEKEKQGKTNLSAEELLTSKKIKRSIMSNLRKSANVAIEEIKRLLKQGYEAIASSLRLKFCPPCNKQLV
uniref:Uncharacterized protein n=1 Tax=Trichuris muris TaxID=70415 RepID=A0A5S6Q9M2_TRIMR